MTNISQPKKQIKPHDENCVDPAKCKQCADYVRKTHISSILSFAFKGGQESAPRA